MKKIRAFLLGLLVLPFVLTNGLLTVKAQAPAMAADIPLESLYSGEAIRLEGLYSGVTLDFDLPTGY